MGKQQFQTEHFNSEEKAFRRVYLRTLSKAARVAVQHPGADEVIAGLSSINTAFKTVLVELDKFKTGQYDEASALESDEGSSGTEGSETVPKPLGKETVPLPDSTPPATPRKKR